MHLKLFSLSDYSLYTFTESFLPSLKSQHKKIIGVATLALIFLAGCYVLCRYRLRAKPYILKINADKKKEIESLSLEEQQIRKHLESLRSQDPVTINGYTFTKFNGRLCRQYKDSLELGDFTDGKLNGQGERILYGNGKLIGKFEMGMFRKGIIEDWKEGIRQEGEFKDDKLNGQGKRIYIGEGVEEGEFKDGQLNGQGKIIFANEGGIDEGEFKDGKLRLGKRIHEDNEVEEGEFIDDILIGPWKGIYLKERL